MVGLEAGVLAKNDLLAAKNLAWDSSLSQLPMKPPLATELGEVCIVKRRRLGVALASSTLELGKKG